MSSTVTLAQLQRAIGSAGYEAPSKSQLKRLRRAGLLPEVEQQHHGGVRGSITVYPEWVVDQLRHVLLLRATVRNFEHLTFWAWWDQLWVDRRTLRNNLLHWASTGLRGLTRIIDRHDDPFDAADAMWAGLGLTNRSAPRFIQERVGPRHAGTVVYLALQLLAGARPMWEGNATTATDSTDGPTADQLLHRASGMDQLTTPIPSPGGTLGVLVEEPPAIDELYDDLQDTGMLSPRSWLNAIRTASVPELNEARKVARAILIDLPLIAQAARYLGADAKNPLGVGQLIREEKKDRATLLQYASFLPLAVLLRRNNPAEIIAENINAMTEAAATIRQALKDVGLEAVPDPPSA